MTDPREPLVLAGGLLVDGIGAEPVRGRVVVVEGGRIAAVTDDRAMPRGTRIDLDGATLLPGLVNCHVHLCLGAEADPARAVRDQAAALTALKVMARARASLDAGVTTVRDLGGDAHSEMAVRRAVEEGWLIGPRIVAAGKVICMTGGHGHWTGREADGPDDVRRAVREQLKAGADVIKIIATGGVLTPGVEPGAPQLSLAEMRAAVEEATRAGRRTAAHAQGSSGIADAVAAGITSIEHGVYLTEEIVAHMCQRGTYLVPTLNAPAAIVEAGVAAGIPDFMVRKSMDVMAGHVASYRLAVEAGVRIAAGADSGTPFNPHGSLLPELRLMVRHGMTPLAAIRSATVEAAALLGRGDSLGRVAPGFAADLLAVTGNPAERIDALGDVRCVIARGRVVPPAAS